MNQIIAEIASILKDSETLLDSEIRLDQYLPKVMCELVSKAIEMIDLELIHTYKEKGYDIQKTMKRTVQFSYGAVEIRRRRMRKDGEKSIVPLDEAIGLEEYIRYSPLVEMKAAKVASDGVYRKAAEAINLLTPLQVSHTTVHKMVQKTGEKVQKWTDEAPSHIETPQKEKRKVPVLFIEGDGLLLKGRGEKNPELHRVQFHEGVTYVGKQKRPVLIGSQVFESTVSSKEAFKRAGQWLEAMYDIRETIIVSNSDGGSGYEKDKFEQIIGKCKKHEHFRDPYHVNEKINQRLNFDKPMIIEMRKAVSAYDKERVLSVLATTESRIEDEETRTEKEEHLRLLGAYLERNWESICPLKMRDLPVQNGIGICESNHRPYSYRMKRQGRGFSAKGAGNLASIISARKNGTLLEALRAELPAFEQTIVPEFKGAVRAVLKKIHRPSIGVKMGEIANYSSTSSPMGQLKKMFG